MLLRERDFRIILASTGLSSLGDELALIALAIRVVDLSGSGLAVAAVLMAGILPLVILAPIAGLLVDRYETTRVLAGATLFQAIVAVALSLVGSIPAIVVLSFLLGAGASVSQPALFALTPNVAGEDRMTQANAHLETSRYLGAVSGPLIAGGLAAGIGVPFALRADAATFLVLALGAVLLQVRRHPERAAEERHRGEAREGFVAIARDRLLLLSISVVAAVVLFAAIDNVAEVFFAKDPKFLGAGDWGYGALAASWMLGMVAGATLIARRLEKERLGAAVLVAAMGGGLAVAVAAVMPKIGIALAMFFAGGVGNGVLNVSMRSLIHHRVPDRLRGRVFAAYAGLAAATQIGATAAGGIVVLTLNAQRALFLAGSGAAAIGLLGMAWYATLPLEARGRRRLPPVSASDMWR